LGEDELMAAMMHDKKFKENTMVFIVPDAIGSVSIVKDIPQQLVRDILKQLRKGGKANV
jgi:3-dehydroquinate synthase